MSFHVQIPVLEFALWMAIVFLKMCHFQLSQLCSWRAEIVLCCLKGEPALQDSFFLVSLGQSVEFRHIWSLEISNKPNQSEPEEPKIRFVAGIHGNAPVGTELLLALAEFLCMNYKKNLAITKVGY